MSIGCNFHARISQNSTRSYTQTIDGRGHNKVEYKSWYQKRAGTAGCQNAACALCAWRANLLPCIIEGSVHLSAATLDLGSFSTKQNCDTCQSCDGWQSNTHTCVVKKDNSSNNRASNIHVRIAHEINPVEGKITLHATTRASLSSHVERL